MGECYHSNYITSAALRGKEGRGPSGRAAPGLSLRSGGLHKDERRRSERRGCMFLEAASVGLPGGLGIKVCMWGGGGVVKRFPSA